MTRVVVLVFKEAAVCFPSGPMERALLQGTCTPSTVPPGSLPATVCTLLSRHGLQCLSLETANADADCFGMVVLAEIPTDGVRLDELRTRLDADGKAQQLTIRVQREDVFRAMHRI